MIERSGGVSLWLDYLIRAGERCVQTGSSHYAAAITLSVLAPVPLLMMAFASGPGVARSVPRSASRSSGGDGGLRRHSDPDARRRCASGDAGPGSGHRPRATSGAPTSSAQVASPPRQSTAPSRSATKSPLSSGAGGSALPLLGRWSNSLSLVARLTMSSRTRCPARTHRRACSGLRACRRSGGPRGWPGLGMARDTAVGGVAQEPVTCSVGRDDASSASWRSHRSRRETQRRGGSGLYVRSMSS
jgi:hypothetical protein